MNPKLIIYLFLFFLGFPFSLWAETLSLDEAIRIALKANPQLLAQRHEIGAAKAETRAEFGALLPHLDFVAFAKRRSDPEAVVPIKGPGEFPSFSRDIYSAEVQLVLPLYEGGRLRSRVRLAELKAEFLKSLKDQTALDLITNVKETFFLALYLKDLAKTQEEVLSALKHEEEEAKLKFSLGRIAQLDLMRIETQVKAEEAALSSTREALRRAKEALMVLLGKPPRSNFSLRGNIEKYLEKFSYRKKPLLFCRPDLVARKKEVLSAREQVELAKRGHLPSLELVSSYGRRAGSGFNDDEEVWEASLRFRLNLFSGGTISARVAQAQANLLAAEARLRAARLAAEKEVSAALSQISEAEERIKHFLAARETAKEAFRVESLKYRTGAGSVTDMLLAQAAWAQAEADYLRACYEKAQALVLYERASALIARGYLNLECENPSREDAREAE